MDNGLVESRTRAQSLILAGMVLVNGQAHNKSGHRISSDSTVVLKQKLPFVSRGGEKLAGALDAFQISPQGRVCLDVGSSTGGFTDCLLQRGAEKVFANDVGTHQLDDRLRINPRVVVMEERHILDVQSTDLSPQPNFAVVDVSFISLTRILNKVNSLIAPHSSVVALVKPQFEVGPKFLKKGVVRSEEKQKEAVQSVKEFAHAAGFEVRGESPSCLKGPKGNQEYFLHLTSGKPI